VFVMAASVVVSIAASLLFRDREEDRLDRRVALALDL